MEKWEKSSRLLRQSEGRRHWRDGQQTSPWVGEGDGEPRWVWLLPAAETMSPSSHSALGHRGTAPIPQHVGALLPRSECHCVSAGPGRVSGLSLPWLPPTPASLPTGTTGHRRRLDWSQSLVQDTLSSPHVTCLYTCASCFVFLICKIL